MCIDTYSHHDQKTGEKPPKVHKRIADTLHEIIRIRASSAYPIWQRRNHIRGNNKQGEIVMLKSGGENDKEESDGEHLNHVRDGWNLAIATNKRKRNDGFEACCHGYFTRALSGVPDCQSQETKQSTYLRWT